MSEPVTLPYLVALRAIPRWCRWRREQNARGTLTKRPDQSTSDIAECRDWETVAYSWGPSVNGKRQRGAPRPCNDAEGAGFVMTGGVALPGGTWLVALDIDSCVDDAGVIAPEVERLLDTFASATEVSPSGYGLRVWCAVRATLEQLRTLRATLRGTWKPRLPSKGAEVQAFTLAGYATVSGDHLDGTPTEIREVPWGTLQALMGSHATAAGAPSPKGYGAEPTFDELREGALEWSKGAQLIAAEWEGLDYESASEAYFALATVLLRAARGWQGPVVEFLLAETNWGLGLAPESRDPGKYERRKWVAAEVARAAAKGAGSQPAAELFEPVEEEEGEKAGPTAAGGPDTLSLADLSEEHAASPPSPGAAASADPTAPAPETPADSSRLPEPRRETNAADRWRSRSVAELYGRGRPREIWQRLLPAGGLAVWYGAPKSGKTYLALGLGLAIAEGRPYLGRRTLPGRVLYLAGEGVMGVADKVAAAIGPERARDHADPIHLQFRVLEGMPSLTDPRVRQRILAEIEALGGVDLVIVDTVSRAIGAAALDENDTEGMGRFVAALDWLRAACGCAVLGIHHENKNGGDRGSSVLRGAADVFARISRARKRASTFAVEDIRDGEPQEPIDVVWEDVVVGEDEHGPVARWRVQAIAQRAERIDPDEGAILAALQRATRPWKAGDFAAELPEIKKTKRQLVLSKLLDAGLVERVGEGPQTTWAIRPVSDASDGFAAD